MTQPKYGVAVYSPLLEGVLTVQPTMKEALEFAEKYGKENPGEWLRIIEHYPLH